MVNFTALLTPFNLGLTEFNLSLTTPNNAITTFTTIRDVYLRVENEKHELKELKNAMVNAWMLYAQLFNIQLQCKNWKDFEVDLKSLIIWCYDIEDLIAEETRKKRKLQRYIRQMVEADKVKGLKERFVRIVKQWEDILSKIKLVQGNKSNDPYLSRSRLPIGRNDDIKECIEKLKKGKDISIIGTCGLGKSLLARTIFDSANIDEQVFEKKLVPIKGGTFVWDDLKTEIERWITSITTSIPDREEEDRKRREKAKAKQGEERDKNRAHNVLIVFDNLLRLGDDLEWGRFLGYVETLQKEKSINIKVIITTRNPSISQLTFTTAYHLEVLSDDHCEELIKQNVHFFIKASPSETMVSTAKSVAKFCEGIPWVAERIGNVIAQQKTKDDLQALKERVSSGDTSEFKEVILPQLTPCYIDMGPVLRRCLAYFILFPKKLPIDRVDLAHLWLAECFFKMDKKLTILQQCQQIDKYVNDLIERSILQSSGQCCYLQYCGQDFAMLAASGTCLHLQQDGPSLSSLKQEVRHLSLSCKLDDDIWTALKHWKIKLRTFLSLYSEHNPGLLGEIPKKLENSLSLLRVLSLRGTNVKQLPEFVSKLQHLRYLDVSFTTIEELPTKFGINHPLQFLKIKNCTKLSKWLTDEIHKLTFLRYVDWEEDFLRAEQVPPHIGYLSHLENLPFFRVGTKEGHFISELGGMDHLQGSICIENLERVEELNQNILDDANNACKLAAQKAKLHMKDGLRRIVLQWNSKKASSCDLSEGILTGLKPHSNVKELKIINYVGVNFPEWMPSSVLEKIELKECCCCDLSALGKMNNLKTLVLTDMESRQVHLRPYGEANTGVCFQTLDLMEFHNLNKLEEWTGFQPGDFPCLKELKFVGCNLIHPELPFIQNLEESNNSVSVSVT